MSDRFNFTQKEQNPSPQLQDVSFKWTDPDFELMSDAGANEIRDKLYGIFVRAEDFTAAYRTAEGLLRRTVEETEDSFDLLHIVLNDSASLAVGRLVVEDLTTQFKEWYTTSISIPLKEEIDRVFDLGVSTSLGAYLGSLEARYLELSARIHCTKAELLDSYQTLLDEKIEGLREEMPSLYEYYWESSRDDTMRNFYPRNVRDSLEITARFREIRTRSLLEKLGLAAEKHERLYGN